MDVDSTGSSPFLLHEVESQESADFVNKSVDFRDSPVFGTFCLAAAAVGVYVPGAPNRFWALAMLVALAQAFIVAYVVYLAIYGAGINLLFNDIGTLGQMLIPVGFLQLMRRSRPFYENGGVSNTMQNWIEDGASGWLTRFWCVASLYGCMQLFFLSPLQIGYLGAAQGMQLTLVNLVINAPACAGIALCFVLISPHLAAVDTVVERAAHESNERSAALQQIKSVMEEADVVLNELTFRPNVFFIIPLLILNTMFLVNEAWIAYDLVYDVVVFDDDAEPKAYITIFFAGNALQQIILIICLIYPAATINSAVHRVGIKTLSHFYGSPEALAAAQWMNGAEIGWTVILFQPTNRFIVGSVTTFVSGILILLSRLVAS